MAKLGWQRLCVVDATTVAYSKRYRIDTGNAMGSSESRFEIDYQKCEVAGDHLDKALELTELGI